MKIIGRLVSLAMTSVLPLGIASAAHAQNVRISLAGSVGALDDGDEF